MNERLSKLMQALPEKYDVALITSKVNRHYYTGISSSAGILVLTRTEAFYLVDFRYIELAKSKENGFEVVLLENQSKQLPELINKLNVKSIAIESNTSISQYLTFAKQLPDANIFQEETLSNLIAEQRSFKTYEEYEILQRAQNIADKSFAEILNFIRVGVRECDIATELAYITRKNGAVKESFDTIAVSGKNTSLPHGVPSEKLIEAGDFFTLDFGVMFDGYCSDMTRTVAVGHITEKQQKLYDTVLEAQLLALDAAKVGVELKKVDAVAREFIYKNGYEGCFGHGLGHSLGMEVHEDPRFNTLATGTLKNGYVMSVEPGIYLPGEFGCRIEDIIYMHNDKLINLASSPKKLLIL